MFIIEEELKKLPAKPGVYIMHGEKDEIIYVGKAISLKNRVRQYFQSSRNKGAKIEQMVTHITRFEYIITDSELEALVLECNLIKEHRPKYNTMLKDDKSYPFIKVTVNEEYPRVLFARRMKKDKAKYFGPYTSAGAVKDVIELVRKLYKVRSCNRVLPRDCGKDRPCLYHHMKQCSAPCQGYVSSEEYKKNIAELLKFLNGDFKDTIDMLTDKMMAASEEMRFEDAMEYRDLIRDNIQYPLLVAQHPEDADLIENELVWLLAAPAADTDWEWVKPGLVSWDWWNGMRLSGVDFRAGRNTESYRYYIDFAAKYGVPYIIMDEGWSASTTDVFRPNPDLDLPGLIAYGKERNVQIVLWLTWLAVEKDMERLFTTLEEWGIPGVKIDFMDRSDQWMVNYYERVTKCAADHHIFVDWHGSYTPKGLFRTYPNLLTYEAVLGMEQGGRCKPDNSNYLPFIRNAVGPMDFTPGGMFCSQPEDNRSTGSNPMASGTRAYQLALYVVFESPLQMMADNPVYYYREHPCTEFIASVPTTWDELRVLRARCGEQVVMARRKGDRWFIGGITNNQPYSTEVALDFLPAGRSYTMTSFEDGVNADLQAMDYKKRERKVDASTVVKIDMVRNGGWAAVIE